MFSPLPFRISRLQVSFGHNASNFRCTRCHFPRSVFHLRSSFKFRPYGSQRPSLRLFPDSTSTLQLSSAILHVSTTELSYSLHCLLYAPVFWSFVYTPHRTAVASASFIPTQIPQEKIIAQANNTLTILLAFLPSNMPTLHLHRCQGSMIRVLTQLLEFAPQRALEHDTHRSPYRYKSHV